MAQQAAAGLKMNRKKTKKALENQDLLPVHAIQSVTVHPHIVPPRGVESTAYYSGKTHISETGKARFEACGNSDAPATPDPALALLAGAWPSLPLADRKAILAIVRRTAAKGVRP